MIKKVLFLILCAAPVLANAQMNDVQIMKLKYKEYEIL